MIVIEGLHILFTGTNGKKTYGITVQSDLPGKICKSKGYQFKWDINTCALNSQSDNTLKEIGIENSDILKIRAMGELNEKDNN